MNDFLCRVRDALSMELISEEGIKALRWQKVLVFRSCRDNQFVELFTKLKKIYDNCEIDVVCHKKHCERIKKSLKVNYIIEYPDELNFSLAEMPQLIMAAIQAEGYDVVVIPFNNPVLLGYDKLLKLSDKLTKKSQTSILGYIGNGKWRSIHFYPFYKKALYYVVRIFFLFLLSVYISIKKLVILKNR